MTKVSVVVPCYNEEQSVPILIGRILKACESLPASREIILVDDGSTDGTWEAIYVAASQNAEVSGIRLSRNFGQQCALYAGISEADGDYVLILDADLQDPPELIHPMLEIAERESADVVYGVRKSRRGTDFLHRLAFSIFYRVLDWLSEYPIPREVGDFRLISRRVVGAILSMPEHHRFLRGMVAWVGYKQVGLPYDRPAREAGDSHYSWSKLLKLALDGITGFSTAPLRLGLFLSAFFAVLGVVAILYIMISIAWGASPPRGWASLMVVLLFCSSLQMLALGFVGDYLGRVFEQVKRRPAFLIADRTRDTP